MNNDNNSSQQSINITPTQWAMVSHIVPFIGYMIPFFNIAAPYILYSILKPTETFPREHAKASVNFQIMATIVGFIIIIPISINLFIITHVVESALFITLSAGLMTVAIAVITLGIVGSMAYNAKRAYDNLPPKYFFKRQFLK